MVASRSPVEELPTEILLAIMGSLDKATSLPPLILSCSTFYHSFQNAKSLIILQVLSNEIGRDVLPEAIATLHLESVGKTSTTVLVSKGKVNLLKQRQVPSVAPTLQKAMALSKFHFYVRYFAADYVSKTLPKQPNISTWNGKHEVSTTEINRIQRAFYRFQMFCNIFPVGTISRRAREDLQERFFGSFLPWENAQLACINDYFFDVVGPAFNDIVEHDMEWGNTRVAYLRDSTALPFQYILTRGMPALYDIAMANSYEDKMESLYSLYPREESQFLYWGLSRPNVEVHDDDVMELLRDMPAAQRERFITPPFCKEDDTGPTDAWFKAHANDTLDDWVYPHMQHYDGSGHREWGYVMWDQKRINNISIDDISESIERMVVAEKRRFAVERRGRVQDSWARRAYIHLAGGRGWWSADDESKLVWVGGSSPWDDAEKRAKCKYCIGRVRCAPHRIVLRIPGAQGVAENITLLGRLPEYPPSRRRRLFD